MTEMTDRRIEPQASSLLVQIYRENWMRDPYRIRCLAAPPYDGWMRLSADLQQQARQRRLAGRVEQQQLIAPDCEKSTGTAMAQKMRQGQQPTKGRGKRELAPEHKQNKKARKAAAAAS